MRRSLSVYFTQSVFTEGGGRCIENGLYCKKLGKNITFSYIYKYTTILVIKVQNKLAKKIENKMANPLCRKRERIYITSIHYQFKLSRSWSKLPRYILAPQILMLFFLKHENTHKKQRMKEDQGKFWKRRNLKSRGNSSVVLPDKQIHAG